MSAVVATPPLQTGQHVIVRSTQLGGLPATIERADAGSVSAVLAVKDDRVPRVVGRDIAIEAMTGRGVLRYSGSLSKESGGVLSIALTGEVERIQRREFVRVSAHVTVTVQGIDTELGGETVTLDISGRGILISDPWALPLGLDVRVELGLPGGDPVSALGRVVRQAAEDQKGIRLDDLPPSDEDRLIKFIRERELQALRASKR
jgi:hypothetical protein